MSAEKQNEIVLPITFVLDSSAGMSGEKGECLEIEMNRLIARLVRLPHRTIQHRLTFITSGGDPRVCELFSSPDEISELCFFPGWANAMYGALYVALEENRFYIQNLHRNGIRCLPPRIYVLFSRMAADEQFGILDRIKFRTDRNVCEFHPVYIGDCESDIDIFLENKFPCMFSKRDQIKDCIDWIYEDLINIVCDSENRRIMADCGKYGLTIK